jgi:cytochrome P450
MHLITLIYALVGLIVARVLLSLYQAFSSPLRNIPGPFFARFTRLWYFNRVNKGHFEEENLALHRQHGPIVQIAPGHYSIDDPAAVKQIYGIGTQFRKSDWYYGWQLVITPLIEEMSSTDQLRRHPDPAKYTVFAGRDIKLHAQQRRKFNAMYSTSNLLNFEPFVDRCADIFTQRLAEFSQSGQTFDMGHWFQCYAFDVIACITYGERFGFLDEGKDIDGAMAHLWSTMRYSTLVGIFSELHKPLWPLASRIPGTGGAGRKYVMDFVQSQLEKRRFERKKRDVETGHAGTKRQLEEGLPEDFLEKMLNAQEQDPEKIKLADVFAMGQSNIIAGSDTTAISLCTILYHLIRDPRVLEKLRAELREKEEAGECSRTKVTYKESLGMPYFQAVVREALRYVVATFAA